MRNPVTAQLEHERALWAQGYRHILGLDEAGRGAWAGPVLAGAVCLPLDQPDALLHTLTGVRDSKQMTSRSRQRLVETIQSVALAWGVGHASPQEIETLGIVRATTLAMDRAIGDASTRANGGTFDFLLSDSIQWKEQAGNPAFSAIVRGDQLSLSIAAASVLAKVTRDRLMQELHQSPDYAPYQFNLHKGYGTAKHRAALQQYGVSAVHRRGFAPVRALLEAHS